MGQGRAVASALLGCAAGPGPAALGPAALTGPARRVAVLLPWAPVAPLRTLRYPHLPSDAPRSPALPRPLPLPPPASLYLPGLRPAPPFTSVYSLPGLTCLFLRPCVIFITFRPHSLVFSVGVCLHSARLQENDTLDWVT